jgi:hypothetical protein
MRIVARVVPQLHELYDAAGVLHIPQPILATEAAALNCASVYGACVLALHCPISR